MLSADYPDSNRTHGAWVTPLDEHLREPIRAGLLLLFASVAFVLLIACVNVANLLLARAASRRREVAVRAALGAGSGRLAGQSLTESVVLGLLGGAAGLLVAYWGIAVAAAAGAERRRRRSASITSGLDMRILAFCAVLSIGTGLLFGVLPAWQLAQPGRQRGPEVWVAYCRWRASPPARCARGVGDRAGLPAARCGGPHLAQLSNAFAGRTGLHNGRHADVVDHAAWRKVSRRRQAADDLRQHRAAPQSHPGRCCHRRDERAAALRNGRTTGCRDRRTGADPGCTHPRASAVGDAGLLQGHWDPGSSRDAVLLCRSKRKSSRGHRQRHDGAPLLAWPVADRPTGRPRRLRMA